MRFLFLLLAWILIQSVSALTPDTRQDADGEKLELIHLLLCSDVVEREPVGIRHSYDMSEERAWCFARLSNNGSMRTVTFVWYHEDEEIYRMDSRIGTSSNWRTWSSVQLKPGSWRVELNTEQGKKLGELRFHVSE